MAANPEKKQQGKDPKKADTKKMSRKISMSLFISIVVMVTTTIVGLVISGYSLSTVYESKMQDIWGILYLQFEREGKLFSEKINSFELKLNKEISLTSENKRFPAGTYSLEKTVKKGTTIPILAKISGRLPLQLELSELEREDLAFETRMTILQYRGENFFATAEKVRKKDDTKTDILTLWPIDIDAMAKKTITVTGAPANSFLIKRYIMTRDGQLVFSADAEIHQQNILKRELVHKFTQNPLGRGFYKVDPRSGADFYGFFSEIPDTNLILFAEAPISLITNQVFFLVQRFIILLVVAVILSFFIIQVSLFSTKAALRELVKHATHIGEGYFDLKFHYQGWSEINTVIGAFNKMSKSLVERDAKIIQLHKEETEKIRLSQEVEIATKIQKNFLPGALLHHDCGLDVYGKYVPAEETAGDWYNYHYNEKTGETIIAIADVSGHGVGSSMFTAIIAGIFEDLAKNSDGIFDSEFFAHKLNRLFGGIGKHQWHSTLLVLKYHKSSGKMLVTSAGSTPPLFITKQEQETHCKYLALPSSLIGLEGEAKFTTKSIDVKPGERIIVCTDGLFEARNLKNKQYGQKRLLKFCLEQFYDGSSETIVNDIYNDWYQYQKNSKETVVAADDLCIVSIKVSV